MDLILHSAEYHGGTSECFMTVRQAESKSNIFSNDMSLSEDVVLWHSQPMRGQRMCHPPVVEPMGW